MISLRRTLYDLSASFIVMLWAIIFIALCPQVQAATVTWVGGGAGMLWSTATNWDTGTVPTAADDVRITSGDEVIINGTAVCRSINISSVNTTLTNNGQLTMMGSPVQAISIGSGSFLNNHGSIDISNATEYGIRISVGTLTNMATGTINISNVTDISARGLSNNGTIFNHGSITINDISRFGFVNATSFQNHGVLEVSDTDDTAITNLGDFDNEMNGRVVVFNNVTHALRNAIRMTNRGLIDLDGSTGSGFFNEGKFDNYDSLKVKNTNSSGIANRDSLINHTAGVILVDSTNSSAIVNDDFSGPDVYFLNHGVIMTTNNRTGIGVAGRLENHGALDIQNNAIRGIAIFGVLHNYSGARISISDVTHPIFEGISTQQAMATLQNEGAITISDISGVGLSNNGTFIQSPTGSCTTTNITLDPFITEVGGVTDILGVLTIND